MLTELEQFWKKINSAKDIAIIANRNRFGDSLGAALGLSVALKKLDKKVTVLADSSERGNIFSFLPGFSEIKEKLDVKPEFTVSVDATNLKINKVKYQYENSKLDFIISLENGWLTSDQISLAQNGYLHDLIITVGCPDFESIGKLAEDHPNFFYRTPIINIDCDLANESYGELNILCTKSASASELVYNVLKEHESKLLDNQSSLAILTGIIARSKNFKTSNVSPDTLAAASELINLGADRDLIVNELYRKRTIKLLKLWGFILAKLNASSDRRFVWSMLSEENLQSAAASIDDLTTLVDELIVSIPETTCIAIFIGDENKSRCFIWSIKNIDVLYLTQNFSATGSKKFASFQIDKPLSETSALAQELEARLQKIG